MSLLIRNVSETYSNGVQGLKDVTLTIPAGMYGLLGPNGSGESTLVRTIAMLQEPDESGIPLGDIDVVNQQAEVRKGGFGCTCEVNSEAFSRVSPSREATLTRS